MTFVVGLTGGIGSGKSAAAEEFARLGASVIDADELARRLTGAGGLAVPAIEQAFGKGFIEPSGAMDRERMRARVFADAAARRELEAILHPLIRDETERLAAAATGPYVVDVVPLLVESPDYRRRVNRVLVVDCPEEVQLARVRARSGLSEQAVRAIMAAQASREERLAAADDVIDNSGSIEEMRRQVAELHARYVRIARGGRE